jgi:hypothetical protein
MQHLEEGTIHAWLDDALDAAESARVERHVAECKTCSEAVAEARGMIAGASRIVSSLDGVPGNVIPRSSGKAPARGWLWRSLRMTPGRAAIAATLLLAVGTMLTVQHAPRDKSVNPVASAAPVAAAAPAIAQEPATTKPSASAPVSGLPSVAMRDAKTTSANAKSKVADTALALAAAPRASDLAVSGAGAPPATPIVATEAAPAKQATKPRAFALSEIVTTTSGAVRKVDSASVDTLSQARAKVLDAARAAVNTNSARQLSEVQNAQVADRRAFAAGAARAIEPVECFRLSSDSAAVGRAGAFLPRQFSLQQTAGAPPQNVVRAVSLDGHIDSAIAGARWERVTPTTTTLYFTRAIGESAPTLTLHFADGRIAGELSTQSGLRNVDVVRSSCRP